MKLDHTPVARHWQSVLALAAPLLLVVLTLGSALLGRDTIVSVTLLTRHMPWQAFYGVDAPGHQFCSTDTIDSVLPGTAYLREQVFAGRNPSWQGLVSGGTAVGSTPDYAMLNPLSLPYWLLPLKLAPAFVKLLEMVVGIGGMFLFLRRLGRSRLAASTAGIVFVTSGFMVMWSTWQQTRTAAWIPALFWAVERLVQRRRPGDAVLVGGVVASMLLGGFPAVTGYALYLAAPYFVLRTLALSAGRWKDVAGRLALGALGLGLGVLLAGIQLVPFAASLSDKNFEARSGLGSVQLPPVGLITAVAPGSYGVCIDGVLKGPANPVELIAYVGAAAAVLAVVAGSLLLRRRSTPSDRGVLPFFSVAVLVVLGLGWLSAPLLDAVNGLPVFANNYVGRIRSVLGFGVAVLAAYGLDQLLDGRRRQAGADPGPVRGRRAALALGWFAVVWALAAVSWVKVTAEYGRTSAYASWRLLDDPALVKPVLVMGLTVLAAAVAWLGRYWVRAGAAALVVALVLAQGVAFFRAVLPGNTLDDFYPVTGAHRFLAENQGHDRFDGAGGTMYPSTALYYGLRAATGHAFLTPEWADLLRTVDVATRQSVTNYEFPVSVTPERAGRNPVLDRLAVKYFAVDPSLLPGSDAPAPEGNGTTSLRAGETVTCRLPGGPLRGIQLGQLGDVPPETKDGLTVSATLHAGSRTVTGARFLRAGLRPGEVLTVPVAGEDLPAGTPVTVDLKVVGAARPLLLAAQDGRVLCRPVAPRADHLRLAYSDAGTLVFQRLDALPRIRWAGRAAVLPTDSTRLAALDAGLPGDTVALDRPAGTASGRTAKVTVEEDQGGTLTAEVDAAGAGYLVVADALQVPGWTATVDGRTTPLLHADHAMVAVPVPAGRHVVHLEYRAPGQRTGAAFTAVGVLLALALLGLDRRRRVRR